MLEVFVPRKFVPSSLEIIDKANEIIREYQAQGFILTLRQLYYQFVSRALIPNKQTEYKRLGSIINDARLAGLIDWSAIEDRTRFLRSHSAWKSPADIIRAAAEGYKIDLWENQRYQPEVWIEKDALVGVIEDVCNEYRVPYFACRGYSSQSEQYTAGLRLRRHIRNGKKPIIFHLGDHDPSGIDMTRDNLDRLSMFSKSDVVIKRLALNMKQVDEYNPPPNPAKETDSRAKEYIKNYGAESWELDALEPRLISSLIRAELEKIINTEAWAWATDREEAERDKVRDAASKIEDEE